MAVPAKAKQMRNPIPRNAETLSDAEAHWADHCATCHANNGSGDTVVGKNLYPKAPAMRLRATQDLSDGELYYTIQNGIRLTGMPAWGETGDNDEDTWKLVHFIRHLPRLTPEEEKEMERLNPKGPEERRKNRRSRSFSTNRPLRPQHNYTIKNTDKGEHNVSSHFDYFGISAARSIGFRPWKRRTCDGHSNENLSFLDHCGDRCKLVRQFQDKCQAEASFGTKS